MFANELEVMSKSVILVNRENDEILFEKDKYIVLPIASLSIS